MRRRRSCERTPDGRASGDVRRGAETSKRRWRSAATIDLVVNRKRRTFTGPPFRRLIDVLREDFGLTGTKEGCGEGECGACTVLVDGEPVNSCLIPVCQVEGQSIRTVESLGAARRAQHAAGGVPARRRRAVRHLHARHADDRDGLDRTGRLRRSRRHPPRARRQSLSLHRLSAHRRRRRVRRARAPDAAQDLSRKRGEPG